MATFPLLVSGAITQYPLEVRTQYSSVVLSYLDGTEQRYAKYVEPVRRWRLDCRELSEAEVDAVLRFFEEQRGRAGTFSFIDPASLAEYRCCFEEDQVQARYEREGTCAMTLTIREVHE